MRAIPVTILKDNMIEIYGLKEQLYKLRYEKEMWGHAEFPVTE